MGYVMTPLYYRHIRMGFGMTPLYHWHLRMSYVTGPHLLNLCECCGGSSLMFAHTQCSLLKKCSVLHKQVILLSKTSVAIIVTSRQHQRPHPV
jgi:hypothetical protein